MNATLLSFSLILVQFIAGAIYFFGNSHRVSSIWIGLSQVAASNLLCGPIVVFFLVKKQNQISAAQPPQKLHGLREGALQSQHQSLNEFLRIMNREPDLSGKSSWDPRKGLQDLDNERCERAEIQLQSTDKTVCN